MSKKGDPKHLTHISDILNAALKKYNPAQNTPIAQIWDIWDRAVGVAIARNAKPDTLKDGLLCVNVSSSVWIHQLKFLEKDMVAKLNAGLERPLITHIRFQIGKIHG